VTVLGRFWLKRWWDTFEEAESGEHIGTGEHIGSDAKPEAPISDKAAIYKLLAVEHWLERDIKPMDWLLSQVMATTTRSLVYAPTGLGKTNIGLALSAHLAAGKDFLHWKTHRACRVLYLDGEMPDILLKGRLQDAMRRLGTIPKGNLLALNRGDFPDMQPLNTVKIDPDTGAKSMPGIAFIEQLLDMFGPFDVIVFDNIQALLSGSMSETDQWQAILPWVFELSRRRTAQNLVPSYRARRQSRLRRQRAKLAARQRDRHGACRDPGSGYFL
jgi:hypothetical protein